jgi:transcriptional regulator with XRE-family HTH domain
MLMARKKPLKPKLWKTRLFNLRKKLGLTQEQAAAECGMTTSAWVAWENRQNYPSRLALNLIKQAFGKKYPDAKSW